MEAAMNHTALSQSGTDERVKLPNLTEEEVDWRGLEELYSSVNQSLYQHRTDYSLRQDDWHIFQKDVDNMFALRHVLDSKLQNNDDNQTHKLDLKDDPASATSLAEQGSGSGAGGLEEGSGGEGTPSRDIWPEPVILNRATEGLPETPCTTHPAPSTPPPPPPPLTPTHPTPQRSEVKVQLESVNDLPDETYPLDRPPRVVSGMSAGQRRGGVRGGEVVAGGEVWLAHQLEEDWLDGEEEGLVFSGNGNNGLTEMETRHDDLLRTHNSLEMGLGLGSYPGQAQTQQSSLIQGLELGLDKEEEEDIFQGQGYLPLSPQTLKPRVQASTTTTTTSTRSPPQTQTGAPQGTGVVVHNPQLQQAHLQIEVQVESQAQLQALDYEGSGSPPQPSSNHTQ